MATDSKPWADTPLAMIPTPMFLTKKHDMFTHGSSHMAMVHNSIFRGYNSIYHQALHISDTDKADFVGYCLTWYKFLKLHADNEDNSLFPRTEEVLQDKTIFLESHKEHDAFMPGLEEFHKYLDSLSSPNDFSGAKLLDIMATFQEPFELHMRAEIKTIASFAKHPNVPPEGSELEKNTNAAFDKREGGALMSAGMTDVMPMFLYNFDRDYEEGMWKDWPPIPGPVRWGIMRFASFLHPGWWKFAACNAGREKIPLYAAKPTAAVAA